MVKRYKSLKDYVYEYISEQILEGKLKPNEKINETVLSQELAISRTPVREALIQLSCEGILTLSPRKGFVLSELTEKEAEELYTVIGGLDALAATLSCALLTDKDYSLMEYYIMGMDSAILTKNYNMYLSQQNEFHNLYLDKCENEVLYDTLNRLKSKLFTRGQTNETFEKGQELLKLSNKEHREILRLFKEKDKNALYDYLTNVHWSVEHAHNELIKR